MCQSIIIASHINLIIKISFLQQLHFCSQMSKLFLISHISTFICIFAFCFAVVLMKIKFVEQRYYLDVQISKFDVSKIQILNVQIQMKRLSIPGFISNEWFNGNCKYKMNLQIRRPSMQCILYYLRKRKTSFMF